jgi:hypothetical protein
MNKIKPYWRKIYWNSPDLPPKGEAVLLCVGDNMYVAWLIITPSYTTGRKHIVTHPEDKYFVVSEYGWGSCCRADNISLNVANLYWTELPEGPN